MTSSRRALLCFYSSEGRGSVGRLTWSGCGCGCCSHCGCGSCETCDSWSETCRQTKTRVRFVEAVLQNLDPNTALTWSGCGSRSGGAGRQGGPR